MRNEPRKARQVEAGLRKHFRLVLSASAGLRPAAGLHRSLRRTPRHPIALADAVGVMLSDAQTAVLRDLGPSSEFSEEKKTAVLMLIASGYIERDGDLFRLTAMGVKALLDRRPSA